MILSSFFFFFFNDTATTEIYTLSLHDALPIFPATARQARRRDQERSDRRAVLDADRRRPERAALRRRRPPDHAGTRGPAHALDRKSTRLNSSHDQISYAVFCLKKKKKEPTLAL